MKASKVPHQILYYTGTDPQNPFGLCPNFYKDPKVISIQLNDSIDRNFLVSSNDTAVFLFEEIKGISRRDPSHFTLIQCKYPYWLKVTM
jgi:hypothetical protein